MLGVDLFSRVLVVLQQRGERQGHNSEGELGFYLNILQGRNVPESR